MESDASAAGPSTSSGSQGLSDAERLRQRRRQKILANQGSRLDRILGSDKTKVKPDKIEDPPMQDVTDSWGSSSIAGGARGSASTIRAESFEDTEEVVNIYRRRPTIPVGSDESENIDASNANQPSTRSTVHEATPSDFEQASSSSSTPMGFFNPQADGSTIHPKLPSWLCRLLLCILGICLSLFNARYMMVTFFSWEIAVLSINGMHGDESPSSVLILIVALMGLKEPQLKRLKFALKFTNCIMTDLSLFIVFSLIPRIII